MPTHSHSTHGSHPSRSRRNMLFASISMCAQRHRLHRRTDTTHTHAHAPLPEARRCPRYAATRRAAARRATSGADAGRGRGERGQGADTEYRSQRPTGIAISVLSASRFINKLYTWQTGFLQGRPNGLFGAHYGPRWPFHRSLDLLSIGSCPVANVSAPRHPRHSSKCKIWVNLDP